MCPAHVRFSYRPGLMVNPFINVRIQGRWDTTGRGARIGTVFRWGIRLDGPTGSANPPGPRSSNSDEQVHGGCNVGNVGWPEAVSRAMCAPGITIRRKAILARDGPKI